MLKELNQQIQEETYSSYIYLAMAADLEANGFKGMATWMQVQAREEKIHADIFLNYILERGDRVELEAIEKPPVSWTSPHALFKAALEHEEHITSRINHMVKVARELNDNATLHMLQWFVEEQVEEEANLWLTGNLARGCSASQHPLPTTRSPVRQPDHNPFFHHC